jgi:hypothetical protein
MTIELYWHEIIGAIGLVLLGYKCLFNSDSKLTGDYVMPLATPFWVIMLILFLVFWGGIFWW